MSSFLLMPNLVFGFRLVDSGTVGGDQTFEQ